MEPSTEWSSWSRLNTRTRHPIRLSVSVDSVPYSEEVYPSLAGSRQFTQDLTDEGSVNNILDALDTNDRTLSWSALLESTVLPLIPDNKWIQQSNTQYEHLYAQLDPDFNSSPPAQKSTMGSGNNKLTRPSNSFNSNSSLTSMQNTLAESYRGLLADVLESPPWYRQLLGPTELDQVVPVLYCMTGEPLKHHGLLFAKQSTEDTSSTYFLEGEASSGKTLYCMKLIQSWMDSQAPDFSVVLYIPLGSIQMTLVKYIVNLTQSKSAIKLLTSLGPSLLVVLDGLTSDLDPALLKEVQDVLNGITFPNSAVLATCSKSLFTSHNKYTVLGMSWTQILSTVKRYFQGRRYLIEYQLVQLLETSNELSRLASNPYMCLLICSLLDSLITGGLDLSMLDLSAAQLNSSLVNRLIQLNQCESTKLARTLEELGKVTLSKLTLGKCTYNDSELTSEMLRTGLLTRSKCLLKTKWKWTLIHPCLVNYLAASYMASFSVPSLMSKMGSLPLVQCLLEENPSDNVSFKVLSLVFGLLGPKSAPLFACLTLLDASMNHLLSFLRSSGSDPASVSAICSVLGSQRCSSVSVNVRTPYAEEWSCLLAAANCPFDSIEIMLKSDSSIGLSRLIQGLCSNDSVTHLKLTAVPGHDFSPLEVNLICGQLLRLVTDRRGTLKTLELRITCLEDKEHGHFQPFVDIVTFALSNQYPAGLEKLALHMDLTSLQMGQLCQAIEMNRSLTQLVLPHLGCGPDGFHSIARLLQSKTDLTSLDLSGAWKSTNSEDELVLLDSGTLSSNSSRTLFQSLQRGQLRSPSIRRKKLTSRNNNSDTALFQRNLPVPTCDVLNHNLDGLHYVFKFVQSQSSLTHLNLSKCVMNWEDVICLGEMVRFSKSLKWLTMEGMKLCDVLPVLIGMGDNSSIDKLELSSSHVVIGDEAVGLVVGALNVNKKLRILGLSNWTFALEDHKTLASIQSYLSSTLLQELDLTNIRVQLKFSPEPSPSNGTLKKGLFRSSIINLKIPTLPLLCPNLTSLKLGSISIQFSKLSRTNLDLVQNLQLPEALTQLDLSGNPNSDSLDMKVLTKALKTICSQCPSLKTLNLSHWKLRSDSCKEAKVLARLSKLTTLNLNNTTVSSSDQRSRTRLDWMLLSSLSSVKSLNNLQWSNYAPNQESLTHLARILSQDFPLGFSLQVSQVPLSQLKAVLNGSLDYVGQSTLVVKKSGKVLDKLKRLF